MSANNKDSMQFILLSVILLIVPMFIFPARFGLELGFGSFAYSIIEIIFYAVVFYFIRSSATMFQLFQGIGLAFLYRIVIGSVFGFLVAIMYGIDFSVAMTLGVSRYLPAIFIHVLAAPFIIKPFFLAISSKSEERPRRYAPERQSSQAAIDRKVKSTIRPTVTKRSPRATTEISSVDSNMGTSVGFDTNGFERAVKYLGEHHAVRLAIVVDGEGLTLATFKRGEIDPEQWAPFSLLFRESNESILGHKEENTKLEQLRLSFQDVKIAITNIKDMSLFVLSDREDDDLLKIRLVQATEMIRKYSSERYGNLLSAVTEEQHVSNT
jgi:predicted regulator of Ras-like GTPase activity (Roadblock/LC7/MglB family)